MSWIKTVAAELFGLFVDDATFAVTILAWLLAVWLVVPRLGVPPTSSPLVLFGGLAIILVESAVRRARR